MSQVVVDVQGDGGVLLKFQVRGTGESPTEGDTVLVNYVGRVFEGNEFDRNHGGYPFSFVVGEGKVVKGLDIVAPRLRVGDKATVTLAPGYAYGEEGSGEDIPPGSTLVFELELVGIKERLKGTSAAQDRERLAALRADREKAEKAFKDKQEKARAKAEETKAKMAEKRANANGKKKGGGGGKKWVPPAEKQSSSSSSSSSTKKSSTRK
ncbi:hypothetical protein CTAYLR_001123 [Chrysophaeum taylorii]|uniref:peptidylprolyl isomerase n=1 Tax=Chrysophaeum taylorii TaxID=2483200 RepID=A0AAD7UPY0_9STRA|nr:hypothetical protein CTAYLR_001123 [Chrysophaeum taylorii]